MHDVVQRARLLIVSLLAFGLLAGCPEETEDGNNGSVIINNGGEEDTGVDMETPDDAGTDMEQPDPDMETTNGFMTGTWEIHDGATDGELLVTLELAHKTGSTDVTGTYEMADGSGPDVGEKRLDNGTFMSETFTAAWSFRINGTSEEFQLNNVTKQDDDLMLGRYLDPREIQPVDISMVRVSQ